MQAWLLLCCQQTSFSFPNFFKKTNLSKHIIVYYMLPPIFQLENYTSLVQKYKHCGENGLKSAKYHNFSFFFFN